MRGPYIPPLRSSQKQIHLPNADVQIVQRVENAGINQSKISVVRFTKSPARFGGLWKWLTLTVNRCQKSPKTKSPPARNWAGPGDPPLTPLCTCIHRRSFGGRLAKPKLETAFCDFLRTFCGSAFCDLLSKYTALSAG